MNLSVTEVMEYASHNVNKAGAVTLTLKAGYDEIGKSATLLRMLGSNIAVKVKQADCYPFFLGTFSLNNVSFNKEGVSTVKLVSIKEATDMGRFSDIVTEMLMQVRFEADIEEEE